MLMRAPEATPCSTIPPEEIVPGAAVAGSQRCCWPRQARPAGLVRSLLSALALGLAAAAGAAVAQSGGPASDRAACEAPAASGVSLTRLGMMARGFNLPGWVDGATVRRPDLDLLATLHRRGFTHVRLPVGAERVMEAFSTKGEVADRLAEIDRAITTLMLIGYAVSLDVHPGAPFNRLHRAEPDRALALLEELWATLARRYGGHDPDRLLFEALNEPVVDAALWGRQGPRLVAAIRREAPGHTIVFGHANSQRIDALANVRPLDDRNVVYAAHFYDPMIFTHQGQDWSDDPLRWLSGVPFPARLSDPPVVRLLESLDRRGRDAADAAMRTALQEPWTEARVEAAVAEAATWAKRHQLPVIINEFGVLGWKAAPADRARWLRTVRRAAERHCIGWTHWEYADAFGFVRRTAQGEVPDETILRALLD
jgi:endoglucanase